MNLEVIIGLEIHAQLSTKSKLWCSCDNDAFDIKPNTRVCPICMGFPGALPFLNKSALQKAFYAGLSLGCQINNFSKFDRKNYFYPDLPTGYQITQNENPVAENGEILILVPGPKDEHGNAGKISAKKIKINRVHLENDAGKLIHTDKETLVDFNRSGSPLIEIVTEPDMRSAVEAKSLAQEIQKILRTIGASKADMEKGMMRFDASVSLRPVGDKNLYPRSEIKNLNSFNSLERAIEFEISRQTKLWEEGNVPDKDSTRGWEEEKGTTKLMRLKESADDYRYFPEPDVPPVFISEERISEISREIPELPADKFLRYKQEYGIGEQDALKLSEDFQLSSFFEETVALGSNKKKSAKFILSVLISKENWKKSKISPKHIFDILNFLDKEVISSSGAKEILDSVITTGKNAEEAMLNLGLEQVSNTQEITKLIENVLQENPIIVEQYKNGKEKVAGFLVGQVMKLSGGSANPAVVKELLLNNLNN